MTAPVSYIAIRDAALRARVASELAGLGWRVVERPSGFHLIEELADVILERAPKPQLGLVVVDEPSPGCRGSSLALGLRELGIDVPITVLARREAAPAEIRDRGIVVVEPERALEVVPAIAREQQAHAA
jgi:FixJ family two-component response regulator